jgi:redox-sensitive bicupin YhaK (pirin superfamily)
MIEPKYQELKANQIPQKSENGVHVKVIAGECMGIKSPVYTITPTTYLDFRLDKSSQFTQPIPNDWNAFIFILKGSGLFGSQSKHASEHHTVVLTQGESITFKNENSEQLHLVLIAGKPLNEPIVQRGPFVMNTQQEIQNTIRDYQYGLNGFEKAVNWESTNKNN